MEVPRILSKSKEKPVITVLLSDTSDEQLKDFRCSVCGKIVFQYYNHIRAIVPGSKDPAQLPKVIQCNGTLRLEDRLGRKANPRCGTIYHVT